MMKSHIPESPDPTTLKDRLAYTLSSVRGTPIHYDMGPYLAVVGRIRARAFSDSSEKALAEAARRLKTDPRRQDTVGLGFPAWKDEVFALTAELCRRLLGLDPYDVQLIAAIALDEGKVVQMRTGEGKTLAAVFPVCLRALEGKGVHVLTANDYLAARDADWMGPVYRFWGLSVSCIDQHTPLAERKAAYAADVTYLTARQLGFDFLRDGLAYDPSDVVQRAFNWALVDEADFLLIDEARIPLVIAGRAEPDHVDLVAVDTATRALFPGSDFSVDTKATKISLTLAGMGRLQELLPIEGPHEPAFETWWARIYVALQARHLYTRDIDYVVKDGKIELVDEFTGRIAEKRRRPWGIQTAIEIKEQVEVQPEGRILGSLTVQHLMARYPGLAAMTATAVPAAREFFEWYGLETMVVPPNKTVIRRDLPDRVFITRGDKNDAIVASVLKDHREGRPVLVGTASVLESRELAEALRREGLSVDVLNAADDRNEAAIVKRAGRFGAVTISTNMAGRGTDIKLAEGEPGNFDRICAAGGLCVIGTNRHESSRVDDQLRGRSGRQGEPGSSRFIVSLEDPLFVRYGMRDFLPRGFLNDTAPVESGHLGEDDAASPGEIRMPGEITDIRVIKEIDRAQRLIESENNKMRRTLRQYSLLVEYQRRDVRALRLDALIDGGLPDTLVDSLPADMEPNRHLVIRFIHELDLFWAEHLAGIEDLKEGIHLVQYGGRDPWLEFTRHAAESFDRGLKDCMSRAAEDWMAAPETDPFAAGHMVPLETWTYTMDEPALPAFSLGLFASSNAATASIAGLPLFLVESVSKFFKRLFSK